MFPLNFIRLSTVLIFVLINFWNAIAQQDTIAQWVVEESSTLCVDGQSNLNHFSCSIDKYSNNDTILVTGNYSKPIRLSGELRMNVASFDCANSLITKDLRKTLKSDDYPVMTIRLLTLECMPSFKQECENLKGWVEVELAGIMKSCEIQYSFTKSNNRIIQLNGSSRFLFSDFKLSPPRKLAGLIRIKDDFEVHFQLMLKTVKA